jgi:hypothetical protein
MTQIFTGITEAAQVDYALESCRCCRADHVLSCAPISLGEIFVLWIHRVNQVERVIAISAGSRELLLVEHVARRQFDIRVLRPRAPLQFPQGS